MGGEGCTVERRGVYCGEEERGALWVGEGCTVGRRGVHCAWHMLVCVWQ